VINKCSNIALFPGKFGCNLLKIGCLTLSDVRMSETSAFRHMCLPEISKMQIWRVLKNYDERFLNLHQITRFPIRIA